MQLKLYRLDILYQCLCSIVFDCTQCFFVQNESLEADRKHPTSNPPTRQVLLVVKLACHHSINCPFYVINHNHAILKLKPNDLLLVDKLRKIQKVVNCHLVSCSINRDRNRNPCTNILIDVST